MTKLLYVVKVIYMTTFYSFHDLSLPFWALHETGRILFASNVSIPFATSERRVTAFHKPLTSVSSRGRA